MRTEVEVRVECENLGHYREMVECEHRAWPFNDCPHSAFCTQEIDKTTPNKVRYPKDEKAFEKMVFEDYWV
jgi:hypothetical protein